MWVELGVKVFRVDNPHTKPIPFWEWLIAEVHKVDRDVIFLSEAFTRRAMMRQLAKIGFTQGYTYFTWKNYRHDLTEYVNELAWGPEREYFRPNFFTNTHDILTAYLVQGGPAAFYTRFVLAATLSPTYGIYSGYEHYENTPLREGSEEYLNSEKYETKRRRLDGPMLDFIARVNAIRRENRRAPVPVQRGLARDGQRAADGLRQAGARQRGDRGREPRPPPAPRPARS